VQPTKYKPGDMISMDQCVVKTTGRLVKIYGGEALHNYFHRGKRYQDTSSNLVWVQNQVSLGAGEIVL